MCACSAGMIVRTGLGINLKIESMATNKLSFFEWFAAREALEGEILSTTFIQDFAKEGAWHGYSDSRPIHEGDCTACPWTCSLCALEDLLEEYRLYFFDKQNSDGDVFYPKET